MALGDGGEFRAPMAIAVIGGLLVSTVLSLVFVPSFFTVMDDVGRFVWWIFGRFIGPTDELPEYLAEQAQHRDRRRIPPPPRPSSCDLYPLSPILMGRGLAMRAGLCSILVADHARSPARVIAARCSDIDARALSPMGEVRGRQRSCKCERGAKGSGRIDEDAPASNSAVCGAWPTWWRPWRRA